MAKKSISQIEQLENVSQDDLLLISHASGDSYQSYAAKISSIVPDVQSQLSSKADVSSLASFANVSCCVSSISDQSTDLQWPSAKCVYQLVGDIENALEALNNGDF